MRRQIERLNRQACQCALCAARPTSNKVMRQKNNPDPLTLVTRDDLEALLANVARTVADSRTAIFGPASISWRVNRESALFLGAGRAALLQLAHPWVALALEQHSSLMSDPIARFHGTFRVVFTMIFGTREQAFGAARWLYALHTRIEGELPRAVAGYASGSRYEANFVPALCWVYATLVDSAVMAYELALPPLSPSEREAYYAESKMLAGLFGIPPDALPENWRAFSAYMQEMVVSDALGVDERSRAMAQSLLVGGGSWVRPPQWYRTLTATWIPERLRAEFGLGVGADEQRTVARVRRWVPRVYRALPSSIRFTGPYQEAQARLAGRDTGIMIQASNHFWIGEKRMPFRA
jgi:uncharacterized protein (DUF2236 family)